MGGYDFPPSVFALVEEPTVRRAVQRVSDFIVLVIPVCTNTQVEPLIADESIDGIRLMCVSPVEFGNVHDYVFLS